MSTSKYQPAPGHRAVYLNGHLVGEVREGLDHKEDVELGRQLLIEKGLYKKVSLERAMFNQATAFAATSSMLYYQKLAHLPRDGQAITPWVVNTAFSIEVYLKTVGCLFGINTRGHKLLRIFEQLPDAAKRLILRAVEPAAKSWKVKEKVDVVRTLSGLNDAFVQWRYHYEVSELNEIYIVPAIVLAGALHNVCQEVLDGRE
ncbi:MULTISPECIES: hypothetical protein [unclassified Herbaspirillum]|uniref:hypothetical protein n=1 Tax=unclassified Herbaspirillum TaxID=2624150 RepID=UPI000C0B4114|nr:MULTISPECIES: hypothetical protein [unclassified Herbaspirillum]MAF02124.1 hypothetical protein [Herbaspirillum sp.]|tara:strand:- start:13991 stop:14596 length:606 start_codon:yes stop_codon:yes gene_type:complete